MKYCPKCKTEYEDRVEMCADCQVPLEKDLPKDSSEETPQKPVKFTELFNTFNPADIVFVESLFNAYDIRYYVQGEQFGHIRPLAQVTRIMVDEEQYEEAKELLKDFKGRFMGLAPRTDGEL